MQHKKAPGYQLKNENVDIVTIISASKSSAVVCFAVRSKGENKKPQNSGTRVPVFAKMLFIF